MQGRYVDVVCAHREIETIRATGKDVWSNVNLFHALMYSQAHLLCDSVGVEETVPRLTSRQQHRQNIPAADSKEYYKRIITIPLLDHLLCELDARFDASSSKLVVEFMQMLPSEIVTLRLQQSSIPQLVQLYKEDLPSFRSLDAELDLWYNKWINDPQLVSDLNTPDKALIHTD